MSTQKAVTFDVKIYGNLVTLFSKEKRKCKYEITVNNEFHISVKGKRHDNVTWSKRFLGRREK